MSYNKNCVDYYATLKGIPSKQSIKVETKNIAKNKIKAEVKQQIKEQIKAGKVNKHNIDESIDKVYNEVMETKLDTIVKDSVDSVLSKDDIPKIEKPKLEVKVGSYYQHYGNHKYYKVLEVATYKETMVDFVVYQAQYYDPVFGDLKVWTQPKARFLETVINEEGKETPRFIYSSI